MTKCKKCGKLLEHHEVYLVHHRNDDKNARRTYCAKYLNGPWSFAPSASGAYGGIERL
jgi:hypothetical protein